MQTKEEKKTLSNIFRYILEKKYLTAMEARKTFGYKSTSPVANLKNENKSQTITSPHIQLLRLKHQIPTRIWNPKKKYSEASIDSIIQKYRLRILYISNSRKSISNSNLFQQNSKYLPFLVGTWYVYSLAVNPEEYYDGVVLRITTINDDYSVTDTDGGIGHLNIRRKESYIEKATKDIENIVLIRFFNEHIVNEILPCSISSSIRNKTNEPLLNFAFMSRKQYDSSEAKRILGEQFKLQLKIDSEFIDRLNKEKESRY